MGRGGRILYKRQRISRDNTRKCRLDRLDRQVTPEGARTEHGATQDKNLAGDDERARFGTAGEIARRGAVALLWEEHPRRSLLVFGVGALGLRRLRRGRRPKGISLAWHRLRRCRRRTGDNRYQSEGCCGRGPQVFVVLIDTPCTPPSRAEHSDQGTPSSSDRQLGRQPRLLYQRFSHVPDDVNLITRPLERGYFVGHWAVACLAGSSTKRPRPSECPIFSCLVRRYAKE